MNLEVVLLRGAEDDLQAAFDAYEDRAEGLGEEFILTVDGSLTSLSRFPEMAPVYYQAIRRLVLRRFPHGVVYSLEGQRILVHAVLDLRQDPKRIRRRLG